MIEQLSDLSQVAIGGVVLIPVVIGLMEFAKKLGLHGRPLMVTAFAVLLAFGGLSGAISEQLIPPPALPWIRVGVLALGFSVVGMASMGVYDVAKKLAGSD
jgi:hypothetical protein